MERKFNKFGKPLPNKDELKLLSITDKIIRKRLFEQRQQISVTSIEIN